MCVFRRICASLGAAAVLVLAANTLPANAATTRSSNVAIVLGGGSEDVGTLQTSGTVLGAPEDSFDEFAFTDLTPDELEADSLTGSGEVIASDKGLGASGRLCAPAHIFCQPMALAGSWSQIEKFGVPSIVGGEPKHLITVPGVAAAGQSARIAVPAGRSVLFAIVHDPSGSPEILVRSPGGRTYSSSRSSRTVIFVRQPQFGLTTVAIVHPQHGTAHGRNYLSLSAALNGVPFQTINIRQPIWRAAAASRKRATRHRRRK